jgi:drug/metabolite transporter (DMT)-like permease
LLWQPALIALVWMSGQLLLFLSLDRGDVSVATPVLGVKIILVAVLVTLVLGEAVPLKLWAAAALSFLAIVLLNRTEGARHHHVGRTIVYSFLSATAYALFDVLIQKWSPGWGVGRLLPVTAAFLALYSAGIIPMFRAPLRAIAPPAWGWLLAGTGVIAVQSAMFVTALGLYRQATAANVLYSSRGLWSVVFVWLVGHWFRNTERELGGRVLRWRLAGAALMTTAIVLVVLG